MFVHPCSPSLDNSLHPDSGDVLEPSISLKKPKLDNNPFGMNEKI